MHPGHNSPKAGQPVLAAVQFPSPDVPDPNVYIDSERPAGEDQQNWDDTGIDNARSVIAEYQQHGPVQPTQADLLRESREVVGTEDSTLLVEDLDSLGSDPSFGDQICMVISDLENIVTSYVTGLDHLNKALSYLNNLASPPSDPVPMDLAKVFQDTYNEFQNTIGPCMNALDTTQWIIEQIHHLFCPTGLSGRR